MKKDTIQINGRSFRVEINMNTAEEWERMSGNKLGQFEIEAAKSVTNGGISTRPMLIWMYCAVKEGEEMDGREFELDFIEFKRMLKPSVMTVFAPIFIKQYIGNQPVSETAVGDNAKLEPEKKKKTILCRLATFVQLPWAKLAGTLLILTLLTLYMCGKL